MARRRRDKVVISLFPFLSILACVIGTLTLLITALAIGQMDTEAVASLDVFERVQRRIEQVNQRIAQLQAELDRLAGQADLDVDAFTEARRRLDQLLREKQRLLNRSEPDEPDIVIPTIDTEAHQRRLKRMRDDLAEQEQRAKEVEADLAKRNLPPDEATVIIQPSGSGSGLTPTFIECTRTGLVVHDGDSPQRVPRATVGTDETFLALLDRIAEHPNASVIFLVRDDALSTYDLAQRIARSRSARNGKLPVIGHGKIDLSIFQTQ